MSARDRRERESPVGAAVGSAAAGTDTGTGAVGAEPVDLPGRPCRVQLVTTSLMEGGAENQVFLLARELKRRGHPVALVSLRDAEAYEQELAELGIPFTSLHMRRRVPDPRGLTRLAAAMRAWRPDVLHSHMVHANLLARLARLLAHVPVQISTAHNLTEGARWRDRAYRLTDPLCTLTTNVCRACVERFVVAGAVPRHKIRYQPNGLDLSAFARDEGERARLRAELGLDAGFVWLAVGRLEAQKDYPTLLRAFFELGPTAPATLLIAGTGPDRAALEALQRGLELGPERVRFLGQRRDVRALMSAADGYVMSSAWEGLPMVLLEAAASRLPMVVTDVGGNAEVVMEGVDGLLVPARSPTELAAAMAALMAMSPARRRAWGDAARAHVEANFALEHVVDGWEALYGELLGRARGAGGASAVAATPTPNERPGRPGQPEPTRAPRLLLVTSVPSTLTAFLLPYAEHYRGLGWRVDAACRGASGCDACARAFDAVHDLPWTRRPRDPVNLLGAPAALRRLVARGGYDLVHAHDPVAAFVTRLALRRVRRRTGVKVIVTAHGFHFYEGGPAARNLAFRTLERLASRWTDELVVINREDLEAAQHFPIPPRHLTYMPGIGVDLERYHPGKVPAEAVAAVRAELGLAEDQPLLLMVAEFNPGKRHLDAVEALARCGRERAVLACAGVGPLEAAVRRRAEALGLAGRVHLLGYRQDVPALVRASRALLLPSEREGLPRSIMEALSLERPVIASRVRGVTELVDEGCGVLHPVGDVEAIAAAIRRLVDDPEVAVAMGRHGRERMRAFDLSVVLALHDALYERALASPASTASATSSMA